MLYTNKWFTCSIYESCKTSYGRSIDTTNRNHVENNVMPTRPSEHSCNNTNSAIN